jgi:hypothetical protein
MAEVQTTTDSGEMTQRFIEFVMMQAQNAALFLGQIPHPETGKGEVNLDLAKMFIDQLIMIRTKTNNNLSKEEQGVLNNAISNLQMVFFEVAKGGDVAPEAAPIEDSQPVEAEKPAEEPKLAAAEPAPASEDESKKKFTKSYGA